MTSQQDVMRSAGCSDVTASRMCSGSDRKRGEDAAAATPAGREGNNQRNPTPERVSWFYVPVGKLRFLQAETPCEGSGYNKVKACVCVDCSHVG